MTEQYSLTGIVVRGNQLGRKIGFPTANLNPIEGKSLPIKNGVYAARVEIKGKVFNGMANIGVRPTLDQHTLTIEVHIFDFSEDIYDQQITLLFYEFIRPEIKFSGIGELKSQLAKDKITILRILSGGPQPDTDTQ